MADMIPYIILTYKSFFIILNLDTMSTLTNVILTCLSHTLVVIIWFFSS